MTTQTDRVRAFRELHASGCFVMPNPWDVGSARVLAGLGFRALATTSAGVAWSAGRPDHGVTLDDTLAHMTTMASSVALPVNADFEGGFAVAPDAVAANVVKAVATGVAGVSIEDSTGDRIAPLFEFELSVRRVQAARRAIDSTGTGVLLTGRSEGFIAGLPDLAETIRRLKAYADAGADCLYAPGVRTAEQVTAIVQAVAPKPVNVLVSSDFTAVDQLAAWGVRRVSVGGALARVALTALKDAAAEIAQHGTFHSFGRLLSVPETNRLFS